MLKRLVFLALTLLLAIVTIAPAASAAQLNPKDGLDGLTEEQIEKSVAEVEHIFTKILVFDKETGYTVKEDELEKSPYPPAQKEGMIAFANYMNKEYNNTDAQISSVQGCLEDTLNLSKGALNQVQKAIEKGEWLTVVGFLGTIGLAISPPAVFAFFLLCGAPVAKIAPKEN
ncbi:MULTISPECIES: hypothetical protein [Bacillus amyloliquefaciens group]|uniref:hypothetical protein n=1 Tax=Bacillus amyloliquefaciens group TaxID=1938374 RepID=UPI0008F80359|nr:hypothetical protein [Bacillus velezensis]QQY04604.1 hypothetical protein JKJ03_14415 [Bacillus velezensis]